MINKEYFQMYKNIKEEPYENTKRYLEEKDEYDNFIVLYFKENCNYSEVLKINIEKI